MSTTIVSKKAKRSFNPQSIGGGVSVDERGAFWARPWIAGVRTWRKLEATSRKAAFKEAATVNFKSKADTFSDLADLYLVADCPNKRMEPRPDAFCKKEKTRIQFLKKYFDDYHPTAVRLKHCLDYKSWRIGKVRRGKGERTVDMDLNTLSNVFNYGVQRGMLDFNYIRSGRPKFRKGNDVRHCRYCAPVDGTELHKLAEYFFSNPRSEVFGWQMLFGAMTGCRTSELLRLRLDAKTPDDAGFISGNYLFLGRRSKNGVHPYALITPELKEMLRCFLSWHDERYPKSPWFLPGRVKDKPVTEMALNHALRKATAALGISHRTPHGMRSFYVTKRRSDGASDPQIAAEIGDKTVDLIRTYGDRPKNWSGGEPLSWLPKTGLPAWQRWASPQAKNPAINGDSKNDSADHLQTTWKKISRIFTDFRFSKNSANTNKIDGFSRSRSLAETPQHNS